MDGNGGREVANRNRDRVACAGIGAVNARPAAIASGALRGVDLPSAGRGRGEPERGAVGQDPILRWRFRG